MTKTSRETQKREYAAREHSFKPSFQEAYVGSLELPPTVVPPDGFEYAWITESIYNVPEPGNMQKAFYRGFVPVPVDRHPEFGIDKLKEIYGNTITTNRIVVGGLCLMERPIELAERERAALDELRASKRHSTEWAQADGPKIVERQNTTMFGREPELDRRRF